MLIVKRPIHPATSILGLDRVPTPRERLVRGILGEELLAKGRTQVVLHLVQFENPDKTHDDVPDGEDEEEDPVEAEEFVRQPLSPQAANGLDHAALEDEGKVGVQEGWVVKLHSPAINSKQVSGSWRNHLMHGFVSLSLSLTFPFEAMKLSNSLKPVY